MKIYTTSCAGQNAADLPILLDKLDAVLADIRLAPHSKHLEWRREYLELLLKSRYHHLAAFGNRVFRDNQSTINNFALGLKIICSWHTNVVLLCDCEDSETCHRFMIADELKKKEFDVEEIEDWRF